MKSQADIEILIDRMERFFKQQQSGDPKFQPKDPQAVLTFKVALHVLDWVVERSDQGDFALKADAIVAQFKKGRRRRLTPKRTVTEDHFAM